MEFCVARLLGQGPLPPDCFVQAVWEAFGHKGQTQPRPVIALPDTTWTWSIAWNEVFHMPNAVLNSSTTSAKHTDGQPSVAYLDLAFWMYPSDPTSGNEEVEPELLRMGQWALPVEADRTPRSLATEICDAPAELIVEAVLVDGASASPSDVAVASEEAAAADSRMQHADTRGGSSPPPSPGTSSAAPAPAAASSTVLSPGSQRRHFSGSAAASALTLLLTSPIVGTPKVPLVATAPRAAPTILMELLRACDGVDVGVVGQCLSAPRPHDRDLGLFVQLFSALCAALGPESLASICDAVSASLATIGVWATPVSPPMAVAASSCLADALLAGNIALRSPVVEGSTSLRPGAPTPGLFSLPICLAGSSQSLACFDFSLPGGLLDLVARRVLESDDDGVLPSAVTRLSEGSLLLLAEESPMRIVEVLKAASRRGIRVAIHVQQSASLFAVDPLSSVSIADISAVGRRSGTPHFFVAALFAPCSMADHLLSAMPIWLTITSPGESGLGGSVSYPHCLVATQASQSAPLRAYLLLAIAGLSAITADAVDFMNVSCALANLLKELSPLVYVDSAPGWVLTRRTISDANASHVEFVSAVAATCPPSIQVSLLDGGFIRFQMVPGMHTTICDVETLGAVIANTDAAIKAVACARRDVEALPPSFLPPNLRLVVPSHDPLVICNVFYHVMMGQNIDHEQAAVASRITTELATASASRHPLIVRLPLGASGALSDRAVTSIRLPLSAFRGGIRPDAALQLAGGVKAALGVILAALPEVEDSSKELQVMREHLLQNGIRVAEDQLKNNADAAESVLSYIPVVGRLASWFAPRPVRVVLQPRLLQLSVPRDHTTFCLRCLSYFLFSPHLSG